MKKIYVLRFVYSKFDADKHLLLNNDKSYEKTKSLFFAGIVSGSGYYRNPGSDRPSQSDAPYFQS